MFEPMEEVEVGVRVLFVRERSRVVYVLFPWCWVLVCIMAVWVWRSVWMAALMKQVWPKFGRPGLCGCAGVAGRAHSPVSSVQYWYHFAA